MQVVLTNGLTSGEICVEGVKGHSSGLMKFPKNPHAIKKAQAYADEQGVFNLYLKNENGAALCKYDPENYGEIASGGKHIIELHEEIIGVYGTLPERGGKIFKTFGFLLLSKQKY